MIVVLAARVGSGTPDPASQLIDGFSRRTDLQFGYQMLVPSGWESLNAGDSRAYFPPGSAGTTDRVTLRVANLNSLGESSAQDGQIQQLELWRRNPSLPKWTAAQRRAWREVGYNPHKEQGLRHVDIYSISPAEGEAQLIAYAVDNRRWTWDSSRTKNGDRGLLLLLAEALVGLQARLRCV